MPNPFDIHDYPPASPPEALEPLLASLSTEVRDGILEAIEFFLRSKKSKRTREEYRKILRDFFRWIGTPPHAVTRKDVLDFRDHLLEEKIGPRGHQGLAPATVALRMSVLRSFFQFLLDEEWVEKDPTRGIPLPSRDPVKPTVALTKEEVLALLRAPNRDTLLGKRDFLLLLILIHDGPRRMEVARIRAKDFGKDGEYFVLHLGVKGGRRHRTKLHPIVWEAFQDYVSALPSPPSPDEPLFVAMSRSGIRTEQAECGMSPEAIRQLVRKYALKAGIAKPVHPHTLRHSFATLALEGGAPLHKVKQALGHRSVTTTERYLHLIEDLADHATDYLHLGAVERQRRR